MDKKKILKKLLRIVETNNKDESLEQMHVWNDILENEYKKLKNVRSRNTIPRVLSNRKFTHMNSDI